MPNNQGARVGKQYTSFTSEVKTVAVQMISQDISNWKNAINSARNVTNPRRRPLLELYENLAIDAHFTAVSNKRKTNITNKRVMFEPAKGIDTVDEKINDLILETPWFYDLRGHACDAKTYGHSLIELIPANDGINIISEAKLVPRMNVKPETGFVAFDALNDTKGIFFRGENADQSIAPYLIEVGKPKDFGLLLIAAQYIIYKRGGFGDWSQFAELFGMPFRVGKYNPFDDSSRRKLDEALSNMGGAGHAVIPEGTSMEFFNNVQSGQSDIFKNIIELSNSEMSKLYLGQTMTTDNGSSKSQSETHQGVEDNINLSDMIEMEYLLNWDFKTKIFNISSIAGLQNGKFRFPEIINIPLDKRFDMDLQLSEKIPMTEEYFYRTYGVAKPGEGEKIILKSAVPNPTEGQKKKLQLKNRSILKLYGTACNTCLSEFTTLTNESEIEKEALRLAKLIHEGKLKSGSIDQELLKQTAKVLMEAVTKGMDKVSDELTEEDKALVKNFSENVYQFSSAKTLEELKQASALLFDAEGNARSFGDFKNDFIALHKTFNVQHLAAEYNHAVASAQMGANWQRLDLSGNGKYATAGDDRVRDEHVLFDQIIAPWKSEFWAVHYPPNGWGCRCDAYDAPEGSTKTDLSSLSLPTIPTMFRNNPGIDKTVFPDAHPYFDVTDSERKKINKAANKANG
jgi:phage gp29-like protein